MEHALDVCIVGPGRLGTALATQLQRNYDCVDTVVARHSSIAKAIALAEKIDAAASEFDSADFDQTVTWLCIPDAALAPCAKALAQKREWRGKIVLHSSGALSSDELQPLRDKGAAVASVHPMMTFAPEATTQLAGVVFALEGDHKAVEAARRLVTSLHGNEFVIAKENKVLYHAFGSFLAPLLLTTLATAEKVGEQAGVPPKLIREAMKRIVGQTVDNFFKLGAEASFTGPFIRGDVSVVKKHLKALDPTQREAYVGLVKAALAYLPVGKAEEIRSLLDEAYSAAK
ncbi:conserved hypothetical protein [Candidatus Koribacter versatilis Ellin345]|uniref:DUF2520 domain-containing protein n=1 Tax=Koribacter versatilis (strain Ellin345) TaxID=204669 RepID=Q1IPQ2_KORVE|nr:Rossmann-like and DUF2520 domain-containing protein [Candidatus Koribacter versatilis]ABF41148.1 conserved hypothetical protein [Candidatus Koribacter versatilis Ellin345]